MQCKSSNKKFLSSDENKPWYRHSAFLIMIMLVNLISWFVGSLYVSQQLDIKPKRLILKSEGCAYLELHHIQTSPYPIEHTCSAEVPFRYLPFSESGVAHIDEENDVVVNGSQIVAVESLPDRPWTAKQRRLAIYGAIGTVAMVGIMTLIFISF